MKKIVSFQINLANILGLLVLIIVLLIVIDVVGRFIFNTPLPGTIELSRVMLAWVLFGSLAYGLVQRSHVRMELFLNHYPSRFRLVANIFIDVLSICFFILIGYGGWLQFLESFKVRETMAAPIWIPFWAAKLALPIGSFIFAGQFGVDIVARLQEAAKESEMKVVPRRKET
jgi:TRAP-type C4-dicarboxylate transport system permease small subunit